MFDKMRKVLGGILVSSPIIILLICIYIEYGIPVVLSVCVSGIVFVTVIILGVELLLPSANKEGEMFDWFKRKKKSRRAHIEDNALIIAVKVDGYAEFVEQMEEMSCLVNTLTKKLERLGEFTEPISMTHNHYHYNLRVNTGEAEKCQL